MATTLRGDGISYSNRSGGTDDVRLLRAFVSFDGTGTVSMLNQYNISSVTDLGVGSYQVNFTEAIGTGTIDYATICASGVSGFSFGCSIDLRKDLSTNLKVVLNTGYYFQWVNTVADNTWVNIAVFRP